MGAGMLEDSVSPDAGAGALQSVNVGGRREGCASAARDVITNLPKCRMPRCPRKCPLQYLQPSTSYTLGRSPFLWGKAS